MTTYFDHFHGSRSRIDGDYLEFEETVESVVLETPGIAVPHSDDARQPDLQSVRQRLFALQDRDRIFRRTGAGKTSPLARGAALSLEVACES